MKRVVVTGMGAITPIGNNVEEFWNNIKDGKVGIDNITKFDTTDFKVKLAAEVKNFNAEEYLGKKVEVLFEEEYIRDGESYIKGHTTNYIVVEVKQIDANKIEENTIQTVEIVDVDGVNLVGND